MLESYTRFRQLLDARDWKTLKQELHDLDHFQLSEIIENLQGEERLILFRLAPHALATETFQHLSRGVQVEVAEGLATNVKKLAALLNDLDPDDRTAFFENLPGEVIQRLLQMLSAEEREIATRLLGYPEDSIGRLMTPEFVAVRPQYTIHKTLEHIRKFGRDSETLDVIYVVDDHWMLCDELRIKEILLADPEQSVAELCDGRFVALSVYDDQEVAVKAFKDYDRVALPVIGTDGTLLGIVTIDDVMDVAEEEHTEDFHKFGGTTELDVSYTRTPLLEMVKKRAGWLVVLFLGEMLTASAMARYDDAIAKAVVLALFVPLIISSGGNSGSQAASLIIRSLALEELKLKNWWYVLRKELLSGLMLGIVLGSIGFVRIGIWQNTGFYDYGIYWPWIGLSVAVSLVCIVMWGTVSGSMIPLMLKRIGMDPATASAPFVATLVDVTGLFIYFSIAVMFLSGKLL